MQATESSFFVYIQSARTTMVMQQKRKFKQLQFQMSEQV